MHRALTVFCLLISLNTPWAQSAQQKAALPEPEYSGQDSLKLLPTSGQAPGETAAPAGPDVNCINFTPLQCGQTLGNQAINPAAGNDFTIFDYDCFSSNAAFNGYDRLYKVTITSATSVHFILDILTPGVDFDIMLLKVCSPPDCYAFSKESNDATGIYREVLDVYLEPAVYYIVVDAPFATYQGLFNLSMNCDCSCAEAANDLPTGQKVFCDGFEDYLPNTPLTPQGTRWVLWNQSAADADVVTDGSKVVRIRPGSNNAPDLVYLLDNATTGRWRLSWKMKVAPGKGAYYNLLHKTPDSSNPNYYWAFDTYFDAGGTGRVQVAGDTVARFEYTADQWINVVHLIDLTKDSIQLWIGGTFVHQWKFSLGADANGNPLTLQRLAAANFYAAPGTDYALDNICLWKSTGLCSNGPADPVCLETGDEIASRQLARCLLYTSEEWGFCNTVCDYGGTLIYRGDTYSGGFDRSDGAPLKLLKAPCILAAYGGQVPDRLAADIYEYYQDPNDPAGTQINLGFSNNGDASTKCFVFSCQKGISTPQGNGPPVLICTNGQYCWLPSDIGSGTASVPLNSCSPFYYVVVTGRPGATYSNLRVTPAGQCPPNPVVLPCGTPVNGTVSAHGDYFSVPGNAQGESAYSQCYNGTHSYTHGEQFFQFTLQQPARIRLTLQSAARMGIFLFPYTCGSNCLAYSENSAIDDQAVLEQDLPDGTYFVVVDKDDNGPVATFSIRLDCDVHHHFASPGAPDACPANPAQFHTVAVPADGYPLDSNDLLYFLYRNTDGTLNSNDSLNWYWPGLSQAVPFNLPGDAGGDTLKCAYALNDTFFLHTVQMESGKRTYQALQAAFALPGPGITGGGQFVPGAASVITRLTAAAKAVNWGAGTGPLHLKDGAQTIAFPFSASEHWTVQVTPPVPWLSVSPAAGDQAERVTVQVQANTAKSARRTALVFRSTAHPDLYRETIPVEQLGPCTIPSVGIAPAAATLCAGQPVSLLASGTPSGSYAFRWNTGDTTAGITVTPLQSGAYAVTITDKNCFSTATSSTFVTVNALPAPPANPLHRTICAGEVVPPLSVSVPVGVIVNWFDQPAGGQLLLANSTAFTPPPLNATYYAESFNPATLCSSAGRTAVGLAIHPVPDLSLVETQCAADLGSYSLVISTNANQVLSSAGTVAGSGTVTISGIPLGTPVEVTALFGNTGCTRVQAFMAPNCPCAAVLPPVGPAQVQVCAGQAMPVLQMTVQAGETVDWFSQENGGPPLATGQGTTSYIPPQPGVYYAETHNLLNGCRSAQRTPVSVILLPQPTLDLLYDSCEINLTHYRVAVHTDANVVTAAPYAVTGLGGGNFVVQNIPTGLAATITALNTSTGCSAQQTVQKVVCNCPALDAPISDGDKTVCSGASLPALSVGVKPGETADWYDTFHTLLLAGNTAFLPPAPGKYFAQTRQAGSGCTSSLLTAVQLDVLPPATVEAGPDTILCAGGLALLHGQFSGASGVTWTASIPGGNFGNASGAATTYAPPAGVGTVLLTLTAKDSSGLCPNVSDQIMLNINPLPVIDITDTVCAPDISTYDIYFKSANVQVTITPPAAGALLFTGNGQYLLQGVPAGLAATIKAVSTLTACVKTVTAPVPQCQCPFLAAPKWLGDGLACPGQVLLPKLSVDPGPGNTADWYGSAAGTDLLLAGAGSFEPPSAGTYYAAARDLLSGCTSPTRTAVKVNYQDTPLAFAGPDREACPGTSMVLTAADVPGASFHWNTGAAASMITVAPVVSTGYTVTVTGSNGCSAADTVRVTVLPAPILNIQELVPIRCHGDTTGVLLAGVSGGSGSGYLLSWSTGQSSPQLANLRAGLYRCTASDGAGCRDTVAYALSEPADLLLIDTTVTPLSDPGQASGAISVVIHGGTPPYTYQWQRNGQVLVGEILPAIANLPAGLYEVEVTDAHDCKILSGPILIETLATAQPEALPAIRVFPNPTTGMVRLAFRLPAAEEVQLRVYDAIGRLVQTAAPGEIREGVVELDLSEQAGGLYRIQIYLNENQAIIRTVLLNK